MRISLVVLVAAALCGCADTDREATPEPEAESDSASAATQGVGTLPSNWKIGFRVGNTYVLEMPELGEVSADLVREFSDDAPPLDPAFARLRIVPLDRLRESANPLVNPERWTVLGLDGTEQSVRFSMLGYVEGAAFVEAWHLVSEDAERLAPFVEVDSWITDETLIIGIGNSVPPRMEVRRKLRETPWENDLPVQGPEHFPEGYDEAKRVLASEDAASERYLSGTSIEAMVGGRVAEVWLLNYGAPDMSVGSHPWGIFVSSEGVLEPIYEFRSEPWNGGQAYSANYHASLVGAVDLDGDGNDEFVIHAAFYEGSVFKIVGFRDGAYREILSSYYRGL